MGRSRRAYRKSKPKVKVGLPGRKPFKPKPADALLPNVLPKDSEWDAAASLIMNYKSFGIVSNPNVVVPKSSDEEVVVSQDLQVPDDSGSDIESDELKSALGKKRRDGKHSQLQRLTKMQRVYVSRLMLKHNNDYQAMSRDLKLNKMQQPPGVLQKLCKRFLAYENLSTYQETK